MGDWGEIGFWVKNVVAGLLLYPASPLFAVIVGWLLLLRRRRLRLGMALVGIGTFVLLAFSIPVVANALAAADERMFPPLDATTPLPADAAIVVLGGGIQLGAEDFDGGTINPTTLARLRSAARLAARTRLPLMVTGGLGLPNGRSEGDEMADSLRQDFHAEVRWIDRTSLDTADNARRSVPVLRAAGINHAVLVTDVSHMRRARVLFEAAGMPVIPAPTDYYASGPVTVLSFIPSGSAMRRSAWSLHERLGLLWTMLRT